MEVIRGKIEEFLKDFGEFAKIKSADLKIEDFLKYYQFNVIYSPEKFDRKTYSSKFKEERLKREDTKSRKKGKKDESRLCTFIGQLLSDYEYGERFKKIYEMFQENRKGNA